MRLMQLVVVRCDQSCEHAHDELKHRFPSFFVFISYPPFRFLRMISEYEYRVFSVGRIAYALIVLRPLYLCVWSLC